MKILLITQEPPLQSEDVVSGNAVRTQQLSSALESAGHEVSQSWLCKDRNRSKGSFRNQDELQGILLQHRPDVVIVSFWELLALLPYDMTENVILDFVAPRPLEEMFESPQTVRDSMRRLRLNLERCDAVMVGNEPQRQLLINTMIEAGFDLRESDPVLVVPLGADALDPPRSTPGKDGWQLVAGGVTWPWRNSGAYTAALENLVEEMQPTLRMVHFGGPYRWHENNSVADQEIPALEQSAIEYRPLAPYRQFNSFLSEKAHIGVELAEWNPERQYSQSFRSLEYLRHGLPLLCNDYLPLARLVEQYDAGWIVHEPESLRPLLERVIGQPDKWQEKSGNALRLVREVLEPGRSVRPLLQWLESPRKAARLPQMPRSQKIEPVLGVPPLAQRLTRQLGLIRQVLFGRIFGQDKGQGVLFITRSDLFPTDHGAAVRTVETARALSRHGLPVGIVTDESKFWYLFSSGEEQKVPFPLWVKLLSLPAPLVKLLHYSKDLPYNNSFLYLPLTDRGFQWRAIAAARRVVPGVLQAEFPAYVQPCLRVRQALNCSVVLVEHNVEYDRIRVQVDELTSAQYENLKAIEIDLCNQADAVVCVSDNDRQKLALDGVDSGLMHTVPHGVNLQHYETAPVTDGRERFGIPTDSPVLVYHGTFSYPPNREALRIFAEILLPKLESRGLICHVLAVGKSPPVTTPHERIHFTGSVDRVAPWLKTADMAVIPLTDGGGTRMKIIDCFAASLPVISTSKGIEGIPVVSGRHALVLDDWNSMADAICELWADREKAHDLARGGREMAESLDWDAIAGKYISIYASLG
jgi:glycosyltransferase involved in cell wall biosynthesis